MNLFANIPKACGGYPPGFERFWSMWPAGKGWPHYHRKVGKAAAAKAWAKHRLEAKTDAMCTLLGRYIRSPGWTKDGGLWIPMPATWLNRQPWDDPDPLAEQEALAAHKRRLAEERKAAARNALAQQIAHATVQRDDDLMMRSTWANLTPAKKHAAHTAYADAHAGIEQREEVVMRWWWKERSCTG